MNSLTSTALKWKDWLALTNALPDTTLLKLLTHFKDPKVLFTLPKQVLAQKSGLSLNQVAIHPDWDHVEKQLGALITHHASLVVWTDSEYPRALRKINRPPPILFVKGNQQALLRPQLAVVGSRKASLYGMKNAYQFAVALSRLGLSITSGLAVGIDTAAHKGALEGQSPTIAVLGSGLDIIYPAINQDLANCIVQAKGVIISEFPFQTVPKAAHFPQRNRIISGLTLGTLVAEAALRSGSLITANYALEQNREVFAIPGPIDNLLSIGCHRLIQQGAKLVTTIEDILEELPPFRANTSLE